MAWEKMNTEERWYHILVTYLDPDLPVPANMVQWILHVTAPEPHTSTREG